MMRTTDKSICPTVVTAFVLCLILPDVTPAHAQIAAGTPTAAPTPRGADDPVVRALLAANPTTPSELVRTAKILVESGQAAAALPLVQRLIEKKLDDEVCAALIEEVGSAMLLRLSRERELNPAAAQFCTSTFAGAARFARDPARLSLLVKQLGAAPAHERVLLIEKLRPGGDAAVAALVAALADPQRSAEHQAIRATLVEFGELAAGPLVAVLNAANASLVAQSLDVLRQIEDPAVADYLLAPTLEVDAPAEVAKAGRRAVAVYFGKIPTPTEAAARLHARVVELLNGIRSPVSPVETAVVAPMLWQWDDAKRELTGVSTTRSTADVAAAITLATDARRLLPGNESIRRLYFHTLAQAIAFVTKEPQAADHLSKAQAALARATIAELRVLLRTALDNDDPAVAAIAARQLAKTEETTLLDEQSPQPSDLVRAASHSDRRLRFAGLEAVMALHPLTPYPGASLVEHSLEYFARSAGTARALVASSSALEASRMGGILAELGYEPDLATDSAGALKLAREAGDYEVIFVDSALGIPVSGQLLQRLRADSRTARVPIALISLADELPEIERLARRIPRCVAVMRTHNAAATEYELKRVLDAAGQAIVDRDERRAQGVQTLQWIAELAGERQQIYDLRRLDAAVLAVLDSPGMTDAAIATLARLDTPSAQRGLANLASRLAAPLQTRQTAARAFAKSVADHGTLLTSEEILQQYDRYNASETQPKETQQILASILDTIEARAQADALVLERPAGSIP